MPSQKRVWVSVVGGAVALGLVAFLNTSPADPTQKHYFLAMGYRVTDTFADVARHTNWSCGDECTRTVRSPSDPNYSPSEILPYGYLPSKAGNPTLFGTTASATIPVSQITGPSEHVFNNEAGKVYFIKSIRVEELYQGRASMSDACFFVFPKPAVYPLTNGLPTDPEARARELAARRSALLLSGYEIYCSNFRSPLPDTRSNPRYTASVTFPGKGYPIRHGQSFTCGYNFFAPASGVGFVSVKPGDLSPADQTLAAASTVVENGVLMARDPAFRGFTGVASPATRPMLNCEVSYTVVPEGQYTAADVAVPVRFPRQDLFRGLRRREDPTTNFLIHPSVWASYAYASSDPQDLFGLNLRTPSHETLDVVATHFTAGASHFENWHLELWRRNNAPSVPDSSCDNRTGWCSTHGGQYFNAQSHFEHDAEFPVRNALDAARSVAPRVDCLTPVAGQVYRAVHHPGRIYEYTNLSLWEQGADWNYVRSLAAVSKHIGPWDAQRTEVRLEGLLTGLPAIGPLNLAVNRISLGGTLATNSTPLAIDSAGVAHIDGSNTTLDNAYYLYATPSACDIPTYSFGGAYGYGTGAIYGNPGAGNAARCPAGRTPQGFYGTHNKDWVAFACSWEPAPGELSPLEFGGFYGYFWDGSKTGIHANPLTKGASCPTGYQPTRVSGTANLDYDFYLCSRVSKAGRKPALLFGGMYSSGSGFESYPNPYTGGQSCPYGYTAAQAVGTPGLDANVRYCYRLPE